jgi:phospholipase/carboxylesterase
VLYLPETAEPGAPLLIFLHSAMGAGHAHLRAALAAVDRYGVILVAPDSRGPTWDLIAEGRFGPDVACLDRVLDALADRVDADTERLAIGGCPTGRPTRCRSG